MVSAPVLVTLRGEPARLERGLREDGTEMMQSQLFNDEELMPCADCVYQGVDSVCRVCGALPCNRRGVWLDKHSPEGRDFMREGTK